MDELREALNRAIPGFDEDGYTQPHESSLQVVFDAARRVLQAQQIQWCTEHKTVAWLEYACTDKVHALVKGECDIEFRLLLEAE